MINTIGVIGAGQMGNGIAHVCALAGLDVKLMDVNQEQLDKALGVMDQNMSRQVKRSLISDDDKLVALSRIETSNSMTVFADCDMVVEAATENEKVKVSIFKELCPHLHADAILASNTSSISITRLAAATDRPAKFMGMHFMNPVPMMKLVELIRGLATDQPTWEGDRGPDLPARQVAGIFRGFPGLHRQPDPAADDQRSRLHAV